MSIGSFLVKQAISSVTRSAGLSRTYTRTSRSGSGIEQIIGAAATAAAVTIGSKVANEVVNKTIGKNDLFNNGSKSFGGDRPAQDMRADDTSASSESNKYADGVLAKIAALCYIARIDGSIDSSEQAELDLAVNDLFSAQGVPDSYKTQASALIASSDAGFLTIQPYLDKADGNVLVSHVVDLESIAKAQGGISDTEKKGIEVYKNYVTSRTGCTFTSENNDPASVDLSCPNCCATMTLDSTYLKATCPYCGTSKIIDAKQISSVIGKNVEG